MVYERLDASDPNFQNYTVKIPRSEAELIAAVEKLVKEGERIYQDMRTELPTIYFDRHLYQPLLVERGDRVKSDPPCLNDNERQFVEDMKEYCRKEKEKSLATKEVFLLRNLSRGKGVGLFDNRRFFPDFILWIKQGDKQRLVFVEPHGMVYARAYAHDEKARLHEVLPKLAESLAKRARLKNVTLDSFIVSATPFKDVRERYDDGSWDRQRFSQAHILFPERTNEYDYMIEFFA